MSEAPIELGPCEITITRSDGSREIIEAVNASVKPTKNAEASGCLPVETYLLAGCRLVDVEVMRAFFQKHRETGLKKT